MKPLTLTVLLALLAAVAMPAAGADSTVLIQVGEDGRYTVWQSKGATALADDEVLALEASARPEGGAPVATSAGPATATETKDGIVISLPAAKRDARLLIDRDACGGIKVWHAEGEVALSEDQLTELHISALPTGGKSVRIGDHVARAYTTKMGVMVVIWPRVAKRP